jgi:dUTP pyrophosphatase
MSSFNDRIQNVFANLRNSFPNTSENFAILKLAVNPNNDQLKNVYEQKVETHNSAILDNVFADSGFDLFVPQNTVFDREIDTKFIDFQVKSEMVYCDVVKNSYRTCAFNVHPRSSISKTPLMLANHTGIIDAGYRGSLIGAFRWLRRSGSVEECYTVEQNTRLVQVCHPSLCPVYVVIVDENELSTTERGAGGFGSTGVGL